MKTKSNLFICLLLSLFLAACGGGGSGSNSGGGGGGGGDGGSGGGDGGGGGGVSSSCGNGGSGGVAGARKLLSRVVTEGQGERAFQYDNQNRLIADSNLGSGNKIEYQGNDSCPSLVTNGTPYPIWSGYDPDGKFVTLPIIYVQYQYGEDSLLNGVPTKYYQTQPLDQNKKPFSKNYFDRHYLNSNDREIAYGGYLSDTDHFWTGAYNSLTYDERGNMLAWQTTRSYGPYGIYTTTVEYTYDGKKGSATGMTTSPWWFDNSTDNIPDNFSDYFFANPNNPLSYTVTQVFPGNNSHIATKETYDYTYDQDGYPTAVNVTTTSRDDQGVETTAKYRRAFEYISRH